MFESFKSALREWKKNYDDKAKLQHFYLFIAIFSVFIGGLVSLINPSVGRQVLYVSVASFGVFIVNAAIWMFIETYVLPKINTRKR